MVWWFFIERVVFVGTIRLGKLLCWTVFEKVGPVVVPVTHDAISLECWMWIIWRWTGNYGILEGDKFWLAEGLQEGEVA